MKKITTLFLVLLLVLSLTACGQKELTAQEIYEASLENMQDPIGMTTVFDFSMIVAEGEGEDAETNSISFEFTSKNMLSRDPFHAYSYTGIKAGTDEFTSDRVAEVHTVEENGRVAIYTRTDDRWTRISPTTTVEEYLASAQALTSADVMPWINGEIPADLTREDEKGTLDGLDVYVIHFSVTMPELTESLGAFMEDLVDLNLDDLATKALPITLYVDTESFAVLQVELSVEGLLQELVYSMLEEEDVDATIRMEMDPITYKLSYDAGDIPALPEEAK